jgi:hypothetical protein
MGLPITFKAGPMATFKPPLIAVKVLTTTGVFVNERNETTSTKMANMIAIEFFNALLF